MAVKIRLMRVGKKKQPTYRVVVAAPRAPRPGRPVAARRPEGPPHAGGGAVAPGGGGVPPPTPPLWGGGGAAARAPPHGRIIETIGHYGPRQDPSRVDIDGDRALAWLRQGAQPTEQVQKLLSVTGVWATFEAEKGGKIVTKLNRRGHVTGKVQPKVKAPPEAKAAAPEAPAPPAEAVEPAEEEPAEASAEAPAEPPTEESAPEESAPEERATEESTE